MEQKKKESILMKDGVSYLVPFILITSCFALWGFANDITNPMVKAFSKIFRMSSTDGALVQVAFYDGYFAMAFPAAIFIRRFSYKAGVLLGLGLYAFGAFLFYPAKMMGEYYPFLLAYFILTCGLSFLETSSNPYILSMGTEETATRRLNLAQSFNPMGSLLGMYVAMNFIQAKLNPLDTAGRTNLSDSEFGVEDIGKQIGLSRVQLYRKVKAMTGSSVVDLLRKARLAKAKRLLESRSMSVSEVAYDVGFSAPSYFTKCFKDEYGILPGDVGNV